MTTKNLKKLKISTTQKIIFFTLFYQRNLIFAFQTFFLRSLWFLITKINKNIANNNNNYNNNNNLIAKTKMIKNAVKNRLKKINQMDRKKFE